MSNLPQPEPAASKKSFFASKEFLVGLVVAIVFIALYAVTLMSYLQEGRWAALPFAIGDENEPNHMFADVKVLSLDPVKGEVSLRVNLTPTGDLTEDEGYSATKSFTVSINSATGQVERSFEKGKAINPFDTVISLDGLVNEYPFDQYQSILYMDVISKDDTGEEAEVPVVMDLTANVPGYQIDASTDPESSSTAPLINLDVKRSNSVISIAVAGMIIMWAIGAAVIFLTLSFVFRNRKPEAFAFYSGLLFGLFGLRNSMPGTPPIGTTSDYLAFIWVEAIVAIMMVITITVSLNRPQKS